ncbi:type II toxin-antitoxin system VapC family toxin [Candidatus Gottesmanbacteria bacterium]|nr:type II toxin-antitoxin system VapC family toxin [Candidatus Gottesmanbacteria bacterium]
MTICIIDSSVILTSLLNLKPTSEKKFKNILQQQKKGSTEVYSTSFLSLEIANGLRFTIKDSTLAKEVFDKFSALPIQYFSLNASQIKEILEISYELQTTVYDTSYHFLAQLLDGTFYTCDEKYYQKAKALGKIEFL